MLFSSRDDFRRCTEIVKKEFSNKSIIVKDEILKKITEDVMNFSYSKGGDYSSKIIRNFAEVYIEHGLYKNI